MSMVSILELRFTGDTFVFVDSDSAKEFAIKKIKEYSEFTEDEKDSEICSINEQCESYEEFDTEYTICYKVPFYG